MELFGILELFVAFIIKNYYLIFTSLKFKIYRIKKINDNTLIQKKAVCNQLFSAKYHIQKREIEDVIYKNWLFIESIVALLSEETFSFIYVLIVGTYSHLKKNKAEIIITTIGMFENFVKISNNKLKTDACKTK